jgi:protein disulfide-isomerase-like protein
MMSLLSALLSFIFLLPLLASSKSFPLTKERFEEVTAGKTVFIKWFAPWCGHCQELAPTWEKLATSLQDDQALIAEVDCTAEEAWCVEMGITGFPTLTYGETSYDGFFLEEYNLEKTFEDLYDFADKTLRTPFCSPGNVDACSPERRVKMYEYWNMTKSDLDAAIQSDEGRIQQSETTFRNYVKEMQSRYDEASRQYEKDAARLKREVKFFKQLARAQASSLQEEL